MVELFDAPGTDELALEAERTRRAAAECDARYAYVAAFDRAWHQSQPAPPRDQGWRRSIAGFRAAGLSVEALLEIVESVLGREEIPPRERWRYLCGACWRTLEQDREAAS